MVTRGNVNWDIFKIKFKKKYVSKRYLDRKKKGFLKLKQRNKSVLEYEREFIHLNSMLVKLCQTRKKCASVLKMN